VKRIAAVARLEIAEKAIAFPAALAIGILPVVLAAGLHGLGPAAEVRDIAAVFLAFLVGTLLAVALGFTSTAGDIASGRIAFYLVRPLSALELWTGKLAGRLAVVFGAALLAALPAAIADGGGMRLPVVPIGQGTRAFPFDAERTPAGLAAAVALIFLLAYLVSQAAGIALLGRSGWFLADLAALAAAAGALWVAGRALLLGGAGGARAAGAAAVVALVFGALAAGSTRSTAHGGRDPGLGHRVRSGTLWVVAAAGVAAISILAAWILHPSPDDLASVAWIAPAPRGDWIATMGRARWRGGYSPVFLENLATGAYLRLGGAGIGTPLRSRPPVISADGRAAAWTTAGLALDSLPSLTPRTIRLDARQPDRVAWETKGLREEPLLVLSGDASRLAIVQSDRITVWDAEGGRMLAVARPTRPLWENARGFTAASFPGRDVLRLYAVRAAALSARESVIDILELDVAHRRLSRTGTAGPFSRTFPIVADASRERLIVRDGPASIALVDGRNGSLIRRIDGGGALSRAADFLSDGRIALFESAEGRGTLALLSREGERRKEFPVGPAERAFILGERRPGAVEIVAGSRADLGVRNGNVLVVDLETGTIEKWCDHLLPAAPYPRLLSGDPGAAPAPGSLATRLFFDRDGALVELVAPYRMRRVLPVR